MLIATGVGTVAGAATGGLGASSAAGTTAGFVAQTTINGVAGASQNLLTQLNHGAVLDDGLLLESASVGLLTAGTTGLVGHVADRYLPSQVSQLRLWSGTARQSPQLSQSTVTRVIGSLVTAETVTGTVRGTFANIGSNLMTKLALAR